MEKGFYLEAIALMESIITDRFESALIFYEFIDPSEAFRTMGQCLEKLHSEGIISDKLYSDLKDWKNGRNRALHEMAKIEEGEQATFDQRYLEQKQIAEKGYVLFNSLKEELQ